MKTIAMSLVLAVALPALAQEKAKMEPPKPNEKLTATFKDAAGTWHCTSETSMPGKEKMKGTSTMKIAPAMGGFIYTMDYNGTMKGMPPFKGMIMWASDGTKLTETWADNMGGMMHGTSDGEADGKTVWMEEGTMMGQPAKTRTTIVRKGKGEILVTGEMEQNGTWTQFSQDACKK